MHTQASVILDADDQTCSTIGAESGPVDVGQTPPICTYFSQTMFANMDKLPDFISSGDNKCARPFRRPTALPPRLAASFTIQQPRAMHAPCMCCACAVHATTHVPRTRAAASFTFNNYAPLLIVILCGCT